jgi:hypothetical protein
MVRFTMQSSHAQEELMACAMRDGEVLWKIRRTPPALQHLKHVANEQSLSMHTCESNQSEIRLPWQCCFVPAHAD